MTEEQHDYVAFSKELRDAAMNESNLDLRYSLRASADLVDNLIDDLQEYRNAAALTDLNGAWAHAWKLLQLHREPKKPQPPKASEAQTVLLRKAA